MTPSTRETEAPLYQLKVTLEDARLPIWRSLLVRGDRTLAQLHDIIQTAMGWHDYHLHQFIVEGSYYGEPHADLEDHLEMRDEGRVRLDQIAPVEGFRFRYEYDFGDSWLHEVLVEELRPAQVGHSCPVCVKGQGACPPEDVGGVWGYDEFLEAIADPDHPEHEDWLDWIGGEFDPEAFDLDEVNAALRTLG
jgi:hypothetical protein